MAADVSALALVAVSLPDGDEADCAVRVVKTDNITACAVRWALSCTHHRVKTGD